MYDPTPGGRSVGNPCSRDFMCGIVGFVDQSAQTARAELTMRVDAMSARLRHRGPDDSGHWVDEMAGLAIGHRRLSIIDLSAAGHQPMLSRNGRFVLSYNGEIYNFLEIRRMLEAKGAVFNGDSDSEVLVEGCAAWGVEGIVTRLNGIFAFAVWDRQDRTLSLVRDRIGIKPLYWAQSGGHFFWTSELKALAEHPAWQSHINRDALAAYMRLRYLPAPHSIYHDAHKLGAGEILVLGPDGKTSINRYWDARQIAANAYAHRVAIDDQEAEEHLDALLRDAVEKQMVADVALGAFLSGGVDSSTVVALMQQASSRPVKTFAIGFHEPAFNEAEGAKAVAQHLGTDHTELYVRPEDAMAVIPKLPEIFDEPFADSSQIPTYLVSELARRHVTVSLSGDGGDEMFGGYHRFDQTNRLQQALAKTPSAAVAVAAKLLPSMSSHKWRSILRILPARYRHAVSADRLDRLASFIAADDDRDLYKRVLSVWGDPAAVVLGAVEPRGLLDDPTIDTDIPDYRESLQLLDMMTYLPDDVLAKVDRASMAASLEARVPMLDHRVVEYVWTLPSDVKSGAGTQKRLLRKVLRRYVPDRLIDREKKGFSVPIGTWLRDPLRDWAEDLLSEDKLRNDGFFDPAPIRRRWQEHVAGDRNWEYSLWSVLMFQAWHAHH